VVEHIGIDPHMAYACLYAFVAMSRLATRARSPEE